VLDSFVYDPLLTWRLLNTASNIPRKEKDKIDIQKTYPQFLQEKTKDKDLERDRGASLI
jgi:FKBP12-rapamycin complex-associated protein